MIARVWLLFLQFAFAFGREVIAQTDRFDEVLESARDSRSASCGGSLKGTSGTFSSPNFPRNYPDDADCTWVIQGPAHASKIDIVFLTLDIEWGRNCDFDYILVKDGKGNQVGPKLCGRPYMKQVSIPGNKAVLQLRSDDSYNEQGFQASYQVTAPTQPPAPGDCDFDAGLCVHWLNAASGDDFDWTIQRGQNPSSLTGPDQDHSGNGQYVYIEATGRKHGDKARLFSPTLSNDTCVEFFYHMEGKIGMGTLNVYIRSQGQEELMLTINGNHGDQWKAGHVELSWNKPYQVVFDGVVGNYDYSDIALDDVTFSPGRCSKIKGCGGDLTKASGSFASPRFPFDKYPNNARCTWSIRPPAQASLILITFDTFNVEMAPGCRNDFVTVTDANGHVVVRDRLCGFFQKGFRVKVHGGIATVYFHSNRYLRRGGFRASYHSVPMTTKDDCDFDSGLCKNWHNSKSDDFDWTINAGNTPSFFTGPHGDYSVIGA